MVAEGAKLLPRKPKFVVCKEALFSPSRRNDIDRKETSRPLQAQFS